MPNTAKQLIRSDNIRQILDCIYTEPKISRTEIAQKIDITLASVSKICKELLAIGVIKEAGSQENNSRPGPRNVKLRINPKYAYVIGITINAFHQIIDIMDLDRKSLYIKTFNFSNLKDAHSLLEKIINIIKQELINHAIQQKDILGIVITISGGVDTEQGVVKVSNALEWENISVSQILKQSLQLPVQVESLPHIRNIVENKFGQTKELRDTILLNITLDISSSFLINRRIIRGHEYKFGNIAFLPILQMGGGERKTLNDVASGKSIILQLYNKKTRSIETHPQLLTKTIQAAQNDDPKAIEAIYNSGKHIGFALNSIADFLRPEAFLITGPFVDVQSFKHGILHGYEISPAHCKPEIIISSTKALGVTKWFAVLEFLLNRPIL